MSIEEDLENMLKYFPSGTGLSFEEIIKKLMSTAEISIMRKMQENLSSFQEQLSERIEDLSGKTPKAENLDPFTILGVDVDATKEDVERAFRKKAWSAHPDHGGDNEQMILVNAAREAIFRFKGW